MTGPRLSGTVPVDDDETDRARRSLVDRLLGQHFVGSTMRRTPGRCKSAASC